MHLFQNALLFDPQNVSSLVLIIAGGAWFVIVVVLVADLFGASGFSLFGKLFWLFLLVLLPILGGFLYAVVTLLRSMVRREADL